MDGKTSIILGIVFLVLAIAIIIFQGGISIWTGILIVLAIFDIVTGLIRMKKE